MIDENKISNCIHAIKKRLSEKSMNSPANSAVKLGYIKSLEILEKQITNYEDAKIADMPYLQSRAIATLAVDFLNEESTMEILSRIPIK